MNLKNLFKLNIIVLIISNFTHFLAYLFQIVMARSMDIPDFGTFNVLNSIVMIVVSFCGIISFGITNYINLNKTNIKNISKYVSSLFYSINILMLFLFLIVVFFIKNIMNVFNIQDNISIYLILLIIYFSMISSIFLGILQGYLLHIKNTLKSFYYAFFRLFFGVLIVSFLGYSYNGALLATLLAHLIVILLAYQVVIKSTQIRFISNDFKYSFINYKQIIPIGFTWLSISFISNIDIILVNIFLSPEITGTYSVASIIGKIAFFIPSGLIFIFYPELLKSKNKRNSLKMLISFLFLTVFFSGVFVYILYLYPDFLIEFFFGERYLGSIDILFLISFYMILVSILNIISYFLLSQNNYRYLYGTLYIYLFMIFFATYQVPNNYFEIVYLLISCIGILLLYYVYCLYRFFNGDKN